MYRYICIVIISIGLAFSVGCSTSYKVKSMPFKSPASLKNVVEVDGAQIAARVFDETVEAKEAFGFDIRGAGILPVQVIFDNQGPHPLEINGQQTFLEDQKGNLWPILNQKTAYERATKYAQTEEIFKEGAYKGFLGAAAGAILGAAIGIVTGEGVGAAAGKGAAVRIRSTIPLNRHIQLLVNQPFLPPILQMERKSEEAPFPVRREYELV
ncbi:hypothetical protein ACFL0M_13260 [Thermodesulfobacteriota bacterium]